MFRIGEVSVLTNVPKKTLRYWESVGLITPKRVDEFTSYRYYDADSVERINQIKYLKGLGLSLAEIKNFSVNTLDDKIKRLFDESASKRASALELLNIQAKGVFKPVTFENDPVAIGHWAFIGMSKTKEQALESNFNMGNNFMIKDLYLMPNGKEYYTIKWTKGKICICGDWHPYEIVGGRLYLTLTYNGKVDSCVVYKRVDRKAHDIQDFILLDDIDKPFVRDSQAEGIFNFVGSAFAQSIDKVDLEKLYTRSSAFLGLYIMPDGVVIWRVEGAVCRLDRDFYTKGYICSHVKESSDPTKGVARKYILKKFNGKTYMILEWKAADYLYTGNISYVVLCSAPLT